MNAMTRRSWWLWLSLPISILALASSAAGVLDERTYGRETPNWAGQAVGQDIGNIVAYVLLPILAFLAARGSLRALLAWVGVLVYSVYSYSIYAFALHFGPFFLAYVAVLGMSVYALIGGLATLPAAEVRARADVRAPLRSTALVLIGIGSLFALLWLSEIVPAAIGGTTPQTLVDAGLASSPVYVLDLAVLLPASIVVGVLLLRRRPWGYALAPGLLIALTLLSVGIVGAFTVLALRGEVVPVPVAFVIAGLAIVQLFVAIRFLRAVGSSALDRVSSRLVA